MEKFDHIVIGGGMMGAPCARHLAEGGGRVALIASPEPRDAATWDGPFASHYDAARITRRVAADRDWSRLSQRSIARYRDLEARSGTTFFHETGALMSGPATGPLAEGFTAPFLEIAAEILPPEAILDAAGVRATLGITVPPGTRASFEATEAGWIDPRGMRDAQIGLAQAAGATVFAQPATARDGGRVTLADGSQIAGAQIVIATGPHAGSDGLLPSRPRLKVWARTIAFARLGPDVAGDLRAMPSVIFVPDGWDHDLYVLPPVRYPDGHVYLKIGGQTDSGRIRSGADMRDWYRGRGDAEVGARLLRELQGLLPDVPFEATHTAPCAVVWSETGYPYVERLDDTVTALVGGNGAAAKCGDELGRLGAMLARGQSIAREGYDCDFGGVWEG